MRQARVQITGLFPTPFLHARGLLSEAQVGELLAQLESAETQGNAKSQLLAHTAEITPTTTSAYGRVAESVLPQVKAFGALLFGEELEWSIKEMWLNALEHGGRQAMHSHANSFVSGVAYLTPSDRSARTVFYRGLGGRDFTFSNDHPGSTPGPFNSPKWAVSEVAPGDVVLFPSYLLHEVPENRGGRRVTLAFNAVPERLKSWGYEIHFSQGRDGNCAERGQ